ncbi:MAG: thioredoxin domain-containing protein [Spirochaetes bacterium]|nr:thioredoxin domain-containing protein [Spirochaetota bacterium]
MAHNNLFADSNLLAEEHSPYLLQHAHNPVNWFPWTDSAFDKAREEEKPIFLSVGYSTCHWCHVMERESFADEEVAAYLNKHFIAIKVDREERPDIDTVYMTVCQALTGSGGWPLTIIMTPEKKPFFAGTYFPKTNKSGRIGLLELLPNIIDYWQDRREELLTSADHITHELSRVSPSSDDQQTDENLLHQIFQYYQKSYDPFFGGFGTKPKFPQIFPLLFLIKYYQQYDSQSALEMVEKTLTAMRKGGIFDQIGFGFHRYSTDQQWLTPHFEKMLYDQALLILAYSKAYEITQNNWFAQTVHEIIGYLSRDMLANEGAYYSAEDADSEGEEGKFYLFEQAEMENILDEETELFLKLFGVKTEGNYIDDQTGTINGQNILHLTDLPMNFAKKHGKELSEFNSWQIRCRKRVLAAREKRIAPFKDKKIITSWNGLAIVALARAGMILNQEDYILQAQKIANFYIKSAFPQLNHNYYQGHWNKYGFLNDHAFVNWGLLELFQATMDVEYLKKTVQLTNFIIEKFYHLPTATFMETSEDNEQLIFQSPQFCDNVLPSGNSVMFHQLIKLYHLTENNQFQQIYESMIQSLPAIYLQHPASIPHFAEGIFKYLHPSSHFILTTEKMDDQAKEIIKSIQKRTSSDQLILVKTKENQSKLEKISPSNKQYSIKQQHTLYICQNYQCHNPITGYSKIINELQKYKSNEISE